MLYKGVVETSSKCMWHSYNFNGKSEINQDVMLYDIMLRRYLAGVRQSCWENEGKPRGNINNLQYLQILWKYMKTNLG